MHEISVVTPAPKRQRCTKAISNTTWLTACAQPGASVSCIALEHGLNTNMLRKWIRIVKTSVPRREFADWRLMATKHHLELPFGGKYRLDVGALGAQV